MKLKNIIITTGGIIGVASSVFLLTFIVLAWTGPQHTPPTCENGEVGCDEVLHTGTAAQSKIGGLLLNTGGATNGLIVSQGKVGIGIDSPTTALEVTGTVKATSFEGSGSSLTGVEGVPTGAILMFDTACPTGWTRFSALDSKFPQGSATYGGTGGSSTHSHTVSLNAKSNNSAAYAYGGGYDHYGTTNSVSNLPPYLNVVWCKKD